MKNPQKWRIIPADMSAKTPAAAVMSPSALADKSRRLTLTEKEEDRLWLAAALEAEKEGVVPREESDAFLRELREKYGG